jgi:hypothetical protein
MVLLGAPLADRQQFTDYSRLFLSTDPADQARLPEAFGGIGQYLATLIGQRSRADATAGSAKSPTQPRKGRRRCTPPTPTGLAPPKPCPA